MDAAGGGFIDFGDLGEGEAAPQAGDDDFALVGRELIEGFGGGLAVDGGFAGRFELFGSGKFGGGGFVSAAARFGTSRGDRAVSHNAEEPGRGVVRAGTLARQPYKGFLDNIFRRNAPLPREQHERPAVPVEQLP
jgi:hypothetical protein